MAKVNYNTITIKHESAVSWLSEHVIAPERPVELLRGITHSNPSNPTHFQGTLHDIVKKPFFIKKGVFNLGDKIVIELKDSTINTNIDVICRYSLLIKEYDDISFLVELLTSVLLDDDAEIRR